MRTARLDHNPDAGIILRTLSSAVPQPIHLITGEVPHPTADAPKTAHLPAYLLLQRLIDKIGKAQLSKALGVGQRTVEKWVKCDRMPTAETKAEIVALYRAHVSQNVPGVAG